MEFNTPTPPSGPDPGGSPNPTGPGNPPVNADEVQPEVPEEKIPAPEPEQVP
jgi:hypothetical protein